jgi:predicted  nucleic acid-binding Zn-ribbon protein
VSGNGNGNGGSNARHITIPIAAAIAALLLGIGGTVFYFGGTLRQVDINTAAIARLDPVGNSLLAMKTEFDNQRKSYDQLAMDVRGLPASDSESRAHIAALRSQVSGMQLELDAIKRDFRPREYWERVAADMNALKIQISELVVVRDRAIPEWNLMIQRIASLEAHFNDLAARAQIVSGEIRDELNFYRNSAARRLELQQQVK